MQPQLNPALLGFNPFKKPISEGRREKDAKNDYGPGPLILILLGLILGLIFGLIFRIDPRRNEDGTMRTR